MELNKINTTAMGEYPAPTRCPTCGDELHITRLQCSHCGTGIDGHFTGGRLSRLTREHLAFVEVFLKCRGKIKDVEEELGISYPTVVSRLGEVVRAMGFEAAAEEPDRAEQRRQILDDLAAGDITPEEAGRRIRALRRGGAPRGA